MHTLLQLKTASPPTQTARGIRSITAALLGLCVIACGPSVKEDTPEVGILQAELTATGSDGTRFRLAGTFDLVGPENDQKIIGEADSSNGLTFRPVVGDYDLTLSAWGIYRIDSGGVATLEPDATVLSPLTQPVTVVRVGLTRVTYEFDLPGNGVVIFARGRLAVDATVTEDLSDGDACIASSQCVSRVCSAGFCQAPTCFDSTQNADETAPDCGGSCAACFVATGTSISASHDHTCGVRTDGTIDCWGYDADGQVSGPNADVGTFAQVAAGHDHTCGVRTDASLICWGAAHASVSSPNADGGSFKQVATGEAYTCAVRMDDTIQCWGDDDNGEVTGPNSDGGTFSQIDVSWDHTCGLRTDGSGVCWGRDNFGQVTGLNSDGGSFTQVIAGKHTSCVVRTDETVACFGGDPVFGGGAEIAVDADGGAFAQLACDDNNICGLRTDGTIVCWGGPLYSLVADANADSSTDFVQIAIGADHACGLHSDGFVSCWGNDADGQVSGAMSLAF